MICNDFQKMLDNYENLSETERLQMTIHAGECKKCREDLDFLLAVINTAKRLPDIKAPEDFIDKLNARIDLENIQTRRKARSKRSFAFGWKKYGSVAACMLLAAVIGVNGKSLVSRMSGQNSGDGVITEEKIVSDGNSAPSAQTPAAINTPTASQLPAESSAPKADMAAIPSLTAPVYTPANTAKPANAASGAGTGNASSSAGVSKSVLTVTPSVTRAPSKPTAAPTVAPAENAATGEDVVKGFSIAEETPSPDTAAEPYTLAKGTYVTPDKNTRAAEQKANTNDLTAGEATSELALGLYTPIDKDGNPTEYAVVTEPIQGAAVSSSILVSSEDEEKVRSLMNKYVTGNYDAYYMTTEDKLNNMFEEMDREGINYENYIDNSGGRISFRLVIVS